MTSRSRQRARTWLVGALAVSLLGLVVDFADGMRCLGGDCAREWWISVLIFAPLPVVLVAGAALLLRRD